MSEYLNFLSSDVGRVKSFTIYSTTPIVYKYHTEHVINHHSPPDVRRVKACLRPSPPRHLSNSNIILTEYTSVQTLLEWPHAVAL